MGDSVVVDVPGLPPSLNARMNWRERAKNNKRFKRDTILLLTGKQPETPFPFVEVEYTWHSSRQTDPDNIIAACKPLLDGCQAAGVILSDGPGVVLRFTVKWVQCPRGKEHVRVEVTSVDSPKEAA